MATKLGQITDDVVDDDDDDDDLHRGQKVNIGQIVGCIT